MTHEPDAESPLVSRNQAGEHPPAHGWAVAAAGLPTRGLGGPASARQGGPAEPPASMQDQAPVLPTQSTDPPHPILSVWYRADLRMAVANDRHADIR
jgi:hypothetical protein